MNKKIVCWFSAGVTSTIATKIALEQYGKDNVDIIFFETGSHHPDNERYLKDCEEKIFGKKIEIVQHHKYKTVDEVVALGYINSPGGAYCTKLLKKDMRFKLERERKWDHQIFGFEYDKKEINRAIRFKEQYPATNPLFPLIELKMDKIKCIEELAKCGVELPMMYRMGYTNNNCVGCVKGGIGYWNKIRVDFPEVFDQMAKREREINATCLMEIKDGKRTRLYLDTLDPQRGRMEAPITSECGVICATEFVEIDHPMLSKVLSGEFSINDVA